MHTVERTLRHCILNMNIQFTQWLHCSIHNTRNTRVSFPTPTSLACAKSHQSYIIIRREMQNLLTTTVGHIHYLQRGALLLLC